MTTPTNTVHKPGMHPMLIAAAVAVVLFCAVGIAAMMGWLPSSGANPDKGQLTSSDMAATNSADAAVASLPRPSAAVAQRDPEPSLAPAPEPARAAVCNSCGVVESIREIKTRAEGSGLGAAGGAVVGGLLGNQVGGGHGRQLATVAGAIGGAVAGNQIEGRVKATTSYDVTVRMDNGKTRTVHQSSVPAWGSGDQVRIVNGVIRSDR